MTNVATNLAGTSRFDRSIYAVFRGGLTLICRLWCRTTVEGRSNIPNVGPFLLAPIHRSILDSPVVSGVTRRRMRFMGADKYWNNRQFGRLLTALGGIPVTRGTPDREALRRCITVLKGGEPLVLFPEGERKSGPLVQPLFDGATYIAVKAGVPIVPVGIGGTERAMPIGARFIRPRKVHVIIGQPIFPPEETSGKAGRDASRAMSVRLHNELQTLFDAAQLRV